MQRNTKTKKNLEIVVPLKHLSNFWRDLDTSLNYCEVSLTLTWSENWVLTGIIKSTTINANPNANPPVEARERIPNVQIKNYNMSIDGKSFFDMSIKNGEETYNQMIGIRRSKKIVLLEDLKEIKKRQCFSSLKIQKKQLFNFDKML